MSHTILQPCFIGPPAETQTSHNFSNQVGWPFLDDSALELFPCFKFQDSPRSPGEGRMIDINHVLLGIFMPQRAPHLVTLDETKNHDVKVFFLRQGDIFCENGTYSSICCWHLNKNCPCGKNLLNLHNKCQRFVSWTCPIYLMRRSWTQCAFEQTNQQKTAFAIWFISPFISPLR